jgi:hypothetical protein
LSGGAWELAGPAIVVSLRAPARRMGAEVAREERLDAGTAPAAGP